MTSPDDRNALLAAALDYAARGWRVIPCVPRQKNPLTNEWQHVATTDPEQIRRWWQRTPDANVGVVAPGSGLCAADVDGDDASRLLQEMSAGDLPDTLHMITGKGERLVYAVPDGLPHPPRTRVFRVPNVEKAEIRFQVSSGFFVAPPSVHPGDPEAGVPPGRLYAWVEGHSPADRPPAPMPVWMQMLLCTPPEQPKQHEQAAAGAFLPGGDFNRRGSWDDLLARHGFKPAGQREKVRMFTRPGKERGTSVTLGYYSARDGSPVLYVFTSSIPELEPDKTYDLFGAYTRFEHGGDFQAACRALEAQGFGRPRPAAQAKGKGGAAAPPPARPWQRQPQESRGGQGLSAAELVDKEFPPPRWAVDGLLAEGLTVLGGRPKQGKSWLCLLIATAVAAGHPLDGRGVPKAGGVLYLALEDTERRLKERLLTLRKGVAWPVPDRLRLVTRWPRADDGGLDLLHDYLEAHRDTALVIVDTLAKFRTPPKGTANSYADDYAAVGGLKDLLDHHGTSGLLIHHTRKLKAEDPFDELSGTMGISGAADGMMVLDRSRGAAEAKLFATGRDLPEGTVPLTWGAEHCRWTLGRMADGIDTTGRMGPDGKAVNLIDKCITWLRKHLADYARPSREIEAAVQLPEKEGGAGLTFATLKEAKSQLSQRRGGPLYSKQISGEWWNGLGSPDTWRLRPEPDRQIGRVEDRTPPRRDTGDGAGPDDEF